MGKIEGDDAEEYLGQVDKFTTWCRTNYLDLNVKKTKESVFDFRKSRQIPENVMINNEAVERVTSYKYLGVKIDDQLSGSDNTDMVYKKGQQRIHCLRVLKNLQINTTIRNLFYKSIIESVLSFSITVWYSKLTVKDKSKLNKIVKMARKLKVNTISLNDLYNKKVIQNVKKIMSDKCHPLHGNYVFLKSGRRLNVHTQRTDRFKKTFVPKSIKIYNHMMGT